MKRLLKNTLALFLCVLMLFGAFTITASAKTIGEYVQGDLVTFGWYPQTRVTHSAIVNKLNVQSAKWNSYGYYTGTGSNTDGNMFPSDYMEYTDVRVDGKMYRGVRFSQYRPFNTGLFSSENNTFQDENGYNQLNNTYWFEWEELQWRVLDTASGLVMCETIIDSQPYNSFLYYGIGANDEEAYWGDANKAHYANNYEKSSVRQWLNNDFYNTAFSSLQRELIVSTELDNSAYSTSYSVYDSATTTDKIYLLSYSDVTNTAYGFDSEIYSYDTARQAQGSDYAKCQGLYVDATDGYSRWWQRTAGDRSHFARYIDYDGVINDDRTGTGNTNIGVRPALNLDLTSDIIQSDVSEIGIIEAPHEHSYKKVVTAATATKCGYTTHTCSDCGDSFIDSYTAPTGKISGFKCKARTSNSETLIWDEMSTAAGYQVQISTKNGKDWDKTVTIKSNKTVTTTFKSLAAGNAYKFRARFYVKAGDGKTYYSPWSQAFSSPTLPNGTSITKLTSAKKAFTAQWKQNKTVTGYQLEYSTSSKFKNAKTVTFKKNKTLKTTVKKLKANKKYYVRIRTYKTISGVKYYSSWSKAKTVKAKK